MTADDAHNQTGKEPQNCQMSNHSVHALTQTVAIYRAVGTHRVNCLFGFTSAGNGLGGILMLSNKSGRIGSKRGKSLIRYLATPSLFALIPSTMHPAGERNSHGVISFGQSDGKVERLVAGAHAIVQVMFGPGSNPCPVSGL